MFLRPLAREDANNTQPDPRMDLEAYINEVCAFDAQWLAQTAERMCAQYARSYKRNRLVQILRDFLCTETMPINTNRRLAPLMNKV